MDTMPALVVAVAIGFAFIRSRAVRLPSRFIVAKPTTVWPLASVGAGIGLAAAAVVVLTSLGAGAIALAVGAVILLAMMRVGAGVTAPHRLVYERGGTSILRSEVIVGVVIFCVIWAGLSRL